MPQRGKKKTKTARIDFEQKTRRAEDGQWACITEGGWRGDEGCPDLSQPLPQACAELDTLSLDVTNGFVVRFSG